MSSRADKLEQLHKSLKKHYKYTEDTTERNVLEYLLYACCLEDAKPEQADEAFAKLQQTYFDWNEVRVTTAIELGEVLSHLPNAVAAGNRIKRCLQSIFESRYQYDIDDLKKANLSKAMEDLQAWQGVSPFVLNFVSQHALGGHSIPADAATLDVLVALEVLTPSEADKKSIPGAERAIPKNKGLEFSNLLHQFAIDFTTNLKSPTALAVFKDLGITPKVAAPSPKPAKKAPPKADAAPVAIPPSPPAPTPVKGTKAPLKDFAKAAGKESGKDTAKDAEDKEASKVAAKSDSAKTAKGESKAVASEAKGKEPKPKTESSKVDSTKPVAKSAPKQTEKPSKSEEASKVAKSPAGKAKEPTTKGKAPAEKAPQEKEAVAKDSADKAEKPAAKKPAADAKKPTKMANNVKITKKKPK